MAIADNMRGLPMDELIGAPLFASANAQFKLASIMETFITQIGFQDNKTRTLDFSLQRPLEDTDRGVIEVQTVQVSAPLLGLVPVPALLIDKITVDFEMEVKTSAQSKSSTDAKVEAKASVGFGPWSASVTGSVATHRENTRSTDNSAKYTVHVEATQQPPAEGMSKLMDLLASAVEPLSISGSGGGN